MTDGEAEKTRRKKKNSRGKRQERIIKQKDLS